MSNRFDNRSIDTFKKQIKFSTLLESYFFNRWIKTCENLEYIEISNPRNNGVDNSGEFIESGNTAGADYLVDLKYKDIDVKDMPLEVKWVPTYGKLTLKENDLKAYIRESAGILFIYSSEKLNIDMRLPKSDYDFDGHIKKIESIEDKIRWGIMFPKSVRNLLDNFRNSGRIKAIYYMGNKPGIVLQQSQFTNWFSEEPWTLRRL
jgi:hypothetical protein